MDFDKISNDLHEVGQLLDGWKSSGAVDALELDLALERLRSAYSALRFAESVPVSSHVEPEPAASLRFLPAWRSVSMMFSRIFRLLTIFLPGWPAPDPKG